MKKFEKPTNRLYSSCAPIALVMLVLSLCALPAKGQGFTFNDFGSVANLTRNGSAVQNGTVLRLNSALQNQAGSAWFNTAQPVSGGFTTSFTFQISNTGNTTFSFPADGLAFVIQNNTTAALGGLGGGIGYQGIPNSLAVEFDTFCNSANADLPTGCATLLSNEVGVQSCGTAANTAVHGACSIGTGTNPVNVSTSVLNLSDGLAHTVQIDYNPSAGCGEFGTGTFNVNLLNNGTATNLLSLCGINLSTKLSLGTGGTALVGFTGATGAFVENNDILNWEFTPRTITQPASSTSPVTYIFNGATGQTVEQIVDLSQSGFTASQLAGINVTVTNSPITPANFPSLVAFTSYAVDKCFVMQGEKDANGNPACKKYQILCTTSTNSTPSGANCPVATTRSEFYKAVFDPAAASTLAGPTLPAVNGFSTAVAYPMATDTWPGGNCVFPDTTLMNDLCPLNILTSFSSVGDPTYTGTGKTINPNSTLIPTHNHPEAQTTVTVVGQNAAGWNNTTSVTVNFSTQAPFVGPPASNNNFVPAPIQSVTFWVDQTANNTDFPPGTAMLATPTGTCPVPSTTPPTPPTAALPPFLSSTGPLGLSNGSHVLGYFSTDCAGTEELQFNKPTGGNWMTSFLTKAINIDTTSPTITGPTLSGPTSTTITASYTCNDADSGIVLCGSQAITPSGGPPAVGQRTPVNVTDTLPNTIGPHSFSVTATDAAGNTTISPTVNYTVYGICPLYDTTKAVHPGAVIPIKMFLCNGATDLSSSSIVVNATGLFQTSTSTSDPVIDAGNANPDMNFRFDPTLGPSTGSTGGYIFNLSTSGLGTGSWVIQFTVTGDPTLKSLPFAIR